MSKSLYQTQIENRAPTSSDTAVIGNWWIDTSASPNALYLYKASGWELQGGSGGGVQQDTSATTIATLETKLNDLINNGKTILSIEFTPTDSYSINVNKVTCADISNPVFTYATQSRTIFSVTMKSTCYLQNINYNPTARNRTYIFSMNASTYAKEIRIKINNNTMYVEWEQIYSTDTNFGTASYSNYIPSADSLITSYTINYI